LLKGRPNATNLELFTDEERAVGTAYKQESKKEPLKLSIKPKLNDFITKSVAIASNKEVIHCWRGE
jgi:tRNA 2-selenouridine synthase